MKLGELRATTANLPDDTELVVWGEEDATWYELNVSQLVPSTPIHSFPVLVFEAGQKVELEFDLGVRTGIDWGGM